MRYKISTPQIIEICDGNKLALSFIEMKYVMGMGALTFLMTRNIPDIVNFTDTIFNYLDVIIFRSKETIPDTNLILDKVRQLETCEFPNKDKMTQLLKNIPKDNLLIGECHGDFTLSNMIFTDKIVYLIDFLDTFIESPLLDIIKLRQDTKHLWTRFLSNSKNCRELITLKYIDDLIKTKYNNIIQTEWYKYLSIMNYVRIYPYISSNEEIKFIKTCLEDYT